MEVFIISRDAFKYLNEKIQNALHQLDDSNEVPFEDLFTDSFMQEHSKFKTVDDFQQALNLPEINSLEILAADDADNIVNQNTDFDDWDAMKNTAGQEYVSRQINAQN